MESTGINGRRLVLGCRHNRLLGHQNGPKRPEFSRFLPFSPHIVNQFFKKNELFLLALNRLEFRYFRAFRYFFLLAKWPGLAVFGPSTLCGPLRLGLRCVETNSKTG